MKLTQGYLFSFLKGCPNEVEQGEGELARGREPSIQRNSQGMYRIVWQKSTRV